MEAQERSEEKLLTSIALKRGIAVTAANTYLPKAMALTGEALKLEMPEITRQCFVLELAEVEDKKRVMEGYYYHLQQFRILESDEILLLLNVLDFMDTLIVRLNLLDLLPGLENTPEEGVKKSIVRLKSCLARTMDVLYPSVLEFELLNFGLQDLSRSLKFTSLKQEKLVLALLQEDITSLSDDGRRGQEILALAEEISSLTRVIRGIEYPAEAMFSDLGSLQLKLQASVKELKPTLYKSSSFYN